MDYLFSFLIFVLIGFYLLIWGKKENYQNWDFMDLPDYCPKVKTIVDVPRFGGVPNQSQVWDIDGRCNCGKFMK